MVCVDSLTMQTPKDISFVFSGYAPLSVRLIEVLEKQNGFTIFDEVILFLNLSLSLSLCFPFLVVTQCSYNVQCTIYMYMYISHVHTLYTHTHMHTQANKH